jgi:hypothetical protein
MSKQSDALIHEVLAQKAQGKTYDQIAKSVSKQFGFEYTAEAVRSLYRRNQHLYDVAAEVPNIKVLKEVARVKRDNSQKTRQTKALLEHFLNTDDILEQIQSAVKSLNKLDLKKTRLPVKKGRSKLTAELMLSDWHIGKLTDSFNTEVARSRIRTYMAAVLSDFQRKAEHYTLEKVVVFLGGDMIENSLMHGPESLSGCEYQNPEQMRVCIELLFAEVFVPLAALGLPVHVIGIAGNHDRPERDKTMNKPGKNSLCWVMYHALKMLTEQAKMKFTWDIPEGAYTLYNYYGDLVLFEHGDNLTAGSTRDGFVKHLMARSQQIGTLIKGVRLGHFHFYYQQDSGQVIINSSLSGQDSYSELRGYNSRAGQVVNYYVDTENRDCSFYHSFLVQLS